MCPFPVRAFPRQIAPFATDPANSHGPPRHDALGLEAIGQVDVLGQRERRRRDLGRRDGARRRAPRSRRRASPRRRARRTRAADTPNRRGKRDDTEAPPRSLGTRRPHVSGAWSRRRGACPHPTPECNRRALQVRASPDPRAVIVSIFHRSGTPLPRDAPQPHRRSAAGRDSWLAGPGSGSRGRGRD